MDKKDFEQISTTENISWNVMKADGAVCKMTDEIVVEHYIEVSVNGIKAFILSCTPEHLRELVVGRLFTECIINGVDDIERLFICGEGNIGEVILKDNVEFRPYTGAEPTCCTGNKEYMEGIRELSVLPEVQLDPKNVFELAERFSEDGRLHKSTSGTHSCYIRFEDGSIAGFEDISRHNALDKAVGYMLLENKNPEKSILYTTGRVAADMVEKTIASGVPVLVSKSVPTTKAVSLSKKYGLKLIVKAWPDSFCMI